MYHLYQDINIYILNNVIYQLIFYIYIYTHVSLKMGQDHIGSGEWIKRNKKFLYHFEILAVFELKKETSKPICEVSQ